MGQRLYGPVGGPVLARMSLTWQTTVLGLITDSSAMVASRMFWLSAAKPATVPS